MDMSEQKIAKVKKAHFSCESFPNELVLK